MVVVPRQAYNALVLQKRMRAFCCAKCTPERKATRWITTEAITIARKALHACLDEWRACQGALPLTTWQAHYDKRQRRSTFYATYSYVGGQGTRWRTRARRGLAAFAAATGRRQFSRHPRRLGTGTGRDRAGG